MSGDKRDVLECLKYELHFLEQGGYEQSPRTPWRPAAMFLDSRSCINFGDPQRSRPCSDCWLTDFVPADFQGEDIPCYHIRLNAQGETIYGMERQYNQAEVRDAVKHWLRTTICRLEQEKLGILAKSTSSVS
jgi:hypothetical protein